MVAKAPARLREEPQPHAIIPLRTIRILTIRNAPGVAVGARGADSARLVTAGSPMICPGTRGSTGRGHLVVYCQAAGCWSAWYEPRHESARL